ncbi:hypothetical protein PHMEG_00027250 [Phytophthora megakarya]|uniref:Uncharacterized protein n=1 Tax=Phytophthora megakarya TaxID=4795 RepID=A0A225V7L9_9STRA|nr:hypothetical protein PHMEG_00027250 [Phytophthora megakarya]
MCTQLTRSGWYGIKIQNYPSVMHGSFDLYVETLKTFLINTDIWAVIENAAMLRATMSDDYVRRANDLARGAILRSVPNADAELICYEQSPKNCELLLHFDPGYKRSTPPSSQGMNALSAESELEARTGKNQGQKQGQQQQSKGRKRGRGRSKFKRNKKMVVKRSMNAGTAMKLVIFKYIVQTKT